MQLVPVLEIRHGKGVHTAPKNRFADEVVKEDVIDMVQRWSDKGVVRLHIVDVDAIESGEPENVDLVSKIKHQFPQIQLQVIGGIKCIESAYVWIDAGADFIVLNARAISQRSLFDDICVEFPNKVLVEVDCFDGKVGMGAGQPKSDLTSLARQLEEDGVVGLVVTDVASRNGNITKGFTSIAEVSESIEIPVFANGIVDKVTDLKEIMSSRLRKPSGVLLGKALYKKGFCLNEAQHVLEEYQTR